MTFDLLLHNVHILAVMDGSDELTLIDWSYLMPVIKAVESHLIGLLQVTSHGVSTP